MIFLFLFFQSLSDSEKAWLSRMAIPQVPPSPSNQFADDQDAARLGQLLFQSPFEHDVACITCHQPEKAFTDGLALGKGLGELARNTPSLFLVGHQRWFFWDGRADSLWSQAIQPILHPKEMGMTRASIMAWLASGPIRKEYEAVFGGLESDHADLVLSNLGKALAAFQRDIEPPQRPFDLLVEEVKAESDITAVSQDAIAGLRLFLGKARCVSCHSGPLFSDLEFHDTRLPNLQPGRFEGIQKLKKDIFLQAGPFSDDRTGAMVAWVENLQANAMHYGQFKTPILRYVSLTPPYMHDGSLASLKEVVQFYNEMEQARPAHHPDPLLVPLDLSENEVNQLVEFLKCL